MNPAWRKFAAQTVPTTAFTRAAAHEERTAPTAATTRQLRSLNLVKGTAVQLSACARGQLVATTTVVRW